ncbi:unnamed protein product [Gongylonema pulchrum]|uniref:Flocculation protein FLO11-like n=1 Tax=Gongylonema pulchrum TaxID=637853 RepID=A0A183EW98_9BILA|nr:unnamed protein product [Gongylonema pulchrum]
MVSTSVNMPKVNSEVEDIGDRRKLTKVSGPKPEIFDHESETAFLQEETNGVQHQAPLTATPEFLAIAPSLNSEEESPSISVTQAFRAFSSTRYTVRSRTNFAKQLKKLIIFTPPPLATSTTVTSSTVVPFVALPETTAATLAPVLSSPTKSGLSPETESSTEETHPFNATLAILEFALLTDSVSRRHNPENASSISAPAEIDLGTKSTTVATTIATLTAISTSATAITATSSGTPDTTEQNSKTSAEVKKTIITPLIPPTLSFLGSSFDWIPFTVPWLNNPQQWPDGLLQRG